MEFTPNPEILAGDDLDITVRITSQIFAIVERATNEALVKAIRAYAEETKNFELIVMPEERLLKILELGAAEYNRREKEKEKC